MLLSIVIPIYNTKKEDFLRLYRSIYKQIEESVEIIIIDDGSNTKCADMVDTVTRTGRNVNVFHKENGGVSSARNKGIQLAQGDYVTFLDADDEVVDGFVSSVKAIIKEYNPDIIFGTMKVYPDTLFSQAKDKIEVFENNEILEVERRLTCIRRIGIIGSVCARIYHKRLFRYVVFNEKIRYSEDQLFNREVVRVAKKIVITPENWYTYIPNTGSATHQKSYFQNYYEMICPYWDKLFQLSEYTDDITREYYRIESLVAFGQLTKKIISCQMKWREKVNSLSVAAKHDYIKDAVSNLNIYNNLKSKRQLLQLMLLKMKKYNILLLIYTMQGRIRSEKSTEN